MSSATSIKDGGVRPKADSTFRPSHFFVLASLILATVGVVMARQSTPANLVLISLTIGAAGAAAAGFYRMLAPLAAADVSIFSDRPSVRSRDALEREKTLVLRSIKELEFDRAMGKVSPHDFDEMAGRLRARAMMLMKRLDEGGSGYRELIEKELKARLRHSREAGLKAGTTDLAGPTASTTENPTCACGTVNDTDAAFCKRCGIRLSVTSS